MLYFTDKEFIHQLLRQSEEASASTIQNADEKNLPENEVPEMEFPLKKKIG